MREALTKTPLLRIFIPFVLGILLYQYINGRYLIPLISISLGIFLYISLSIIRNPKFKLRLTYLFSLAFCFIGFGIGWLNALTHSPKELDIDTRENYIAQASVLKVKHNDFTTSADLSIHWLSDSSNSIINTNGAKIKALFEGSDYSLTEGDIIALSTKLEPIINSGNPEEFDYKTHCRYNGFLYQTFVERDKYSIIGEQHSMASSRKKIQNYLTNLILSSGLSPGSQYFYITLILGDKTFINDEVRIVMSQAGIAHILAISGLHIGIVFMIISVLLFPLDLFGCKKLRLVITLFVIIIFGVLIGMPISVIRAITMITFVVLAKIFYRREYSINSLIGAALVITTIDPFSIYDIGFQLSFTSVLCILLFTTKLNMRPFGVKWLNYIYSLGIVSISAILGTAIISAYHFNIISLASIISNIIITPFLPILIGVAILYIILLLLGIDMFLLQFLLDKSYSVVINISNFMADIPIPYIDNIYINSIIVWFYFSLLASIILIIYYRKKWTFYLSAINFISFISIIIVTELKSERSGFIIFNESSTTPICTITNNAFNIWIPENDILSDNFLSRHKNLLSKLKKDTISFTDSPFYHINSLVCIHGKRIAVAKDKYFRTHKISPKLNVDYLIVTKRYYGTIKELLNNFEPKLVVLSGDIYYDRLADLQSECLELKRSYHSIRTMGAIYEFVH